MITPLEIENKKFSKQMMNGYSVEEVDDFLDDLTACYEKLYKEGNESQDKIAELQKQIDHYKQIEGTLNSTLIVAQSTAEDIKNVAKQQADQIIKDAEAEAKQSLQALEQKILLKQKDYDDLQKKFDVYKAKMESLLVSQGELIKEINKNED